MNLKALKEHFTKELEVNYPPQECEALFFMAADKISGWPRNKVLLHLDQLVEGITLHAYLNVLERLKKLEPIQYILEEAHFYDLTFYVNPGVLIPRAETEELVHWVLDIAKTGSVDALLDIGTGSGCIAISLKKHLPQCSVYAMDISAGALETAKNNALLNQTPIALIQADILTFESTLMFDVIVSNPPYIKEDEKAAMHENVLNHEPHSALFVSNQNPLLFYAAIADFALKSLNLDGHLFFEINEYLGQQTVDLLAVKGFKDIRLKKDMQGKDRMIYCRRKTNFSGEIV